MLDTITFFNYFNNGDFHVSRWFIKDMMDKLKNKYKFFYAQNSQHSRGLILKDLENLELSFYLPPDEHSSFVQEKNIIYINTWYAQGHWKYSKEHECSLYTLYKIFIDVYKYFDIPIENIEFYIPKIIFENLPISNMDLSKLSLYPKKILVCTGNTLSGQCHNFSFHNIVFKLAQKYTSILWMTTTDFSFNLDNVVSTNKITNVDMDLNEIAYLSTLCSIIIGRTSGPYTFSIIEKNVINPDKTFICFCKEKIHSLILREPHYKCKLVWSDNFDLDHVTFTISTTVDQNL